MEIAKFDLSLTLWTTDQGLRGALSYSTDLFEPGTIERMVRHLERVLEQVAADADVRLSRLELLGRAERALVLEEWNRTERPYPRGVCVHELFEAQVRERPGAVALAWGDAVADVRGAGRAGQPAGAPPRPAGRGPRVARGRAAGAERGADRLDPGRAEGGRRYVPLDPGYPAERLRLMLDDSSVRVLLSRGDLAGWSETGGLDVVHLDHAADALASEPVDAPRSGATAENLAYIVYTSGSTGPPKGMMVGPPPGRPARRGDRLRAAAPGRPRRAGVECRLRRADLRGLGRVPQRGHPGGNPPGRAPCAARPSRDAARGARHHALPHDRAAEPALARAAGHLRSAARGALRRAGRGRRQRAAAAEGRRPQRAAAHVRPHGDDRRSACTSRWSTSRRTR